MTAQTSESTRWLCACKQVTLYDGKSVIRDGYVHRSARCMTLADDAVQAAMEPPGPLTLEQRVEALEARLDGLERTARRAYDIASAAQEWGPGR